jgi:hypothetical protein
MSDTDRTEPMVPAAELRRVQRELAIVRGVYDDLLVLTDNDDEWEYATNDPLDALTTLMKKAVLARRQLGDDHRSVS